jgi:hypothetical protein
MSKKEEEVRKEKDNKDIQEKIKTSEEKFVQEKPIEKE